MDGDPAPPQDPAVAPTQGLLFPEDRAAEAGSPAGRLAAELRSFLCDGRATTVDVCRGAEGAAEVPLLRNQFWTARQRDAHPLHEVSYRACFKPALPRFFVERLTAPGEVVHDPFLGRGTTALEAALLGRVPSGCDVNPLSLVLTAPRLDPPELDAIAARLDGLDLSCADALDDDLLAFFHPDTLRQILALRSQLLAREADGRLDAVDRWIRMVAVNRLTGHSSGFLSVYTMPPNQAVTAAAQRKINAKRGQVPEPRDLRAVILRKSRQLLAEVDAAVRARLAEARTAARLVCGDSASTPQIPDASVALVVTSPPFLDVVQYRSDNWMRCWFCGIDPNGVSVAELSRLDDWKQLMTAVLREQHRILRPGGHVAFEVGEVRGGKVRLEEHVLDCALAAGLEACFVVVQDHAFTKTANCWGIENNRRGTNTNRVVVLRRAGTSGDRKRRRQPRP